MMHEDKLQPNVLEIDPLNLQALKAEDRALLHQFFLAEEEKQKRDPTKQKVFFKETDYPFGDQIIRFKTTLIRREKHESIVTYPSYDSLPPPEERDENTIYAVNRPDGGTDLYTKKETFSINALQHIRFAPGDPIRNPKIISEVMRASTQGPFDRYLYDIFIPAKKLGAGSWGTVYDVLGRLEHTQDGQMEFVQYNFPMIVKHSVVPNNNEYYGRVFIPKKESQTWMDLDAIARNKWLALDEKEKGELKTSETKKPTSKKDYSQDEEKFVTDVFMVQRKFPGKTLADFLDEENEKLTDEDRLELTYQLLKALCEFHESKFIHRDIKPENIMVYRNDKGEFEVHLIDVGFTKKEGSTKSLVGTELYIPPEIYAGVSSVKEVSQQHDIYAMGWVLSEVLKDPSYENRLFLSRQFSLDEIRGVVSAYVLAEYHLDIFSVVSLSRRNTMKSLLVEMTMPRPERRLKTSEEVLSRFKEIQAKKPDAQKQIEPEREEKISQSTLLEKQVALDHPKLTFENKIILLANRCQPFLKRYPCFQGFLSLCPFLQNGVAAKNNKSVMQWLDYALKTSPEDMIFEDVVKFRDLLNFDKKEYLKQCVNTFGRVNQTREYSALIYILKLSLGKISDEKSLVKLIKYVDVAMEKPESVGVSCAKIIKLLGTSISSHEKETSIKLCYLVLFQKLINSNSLSSEVFASYRKDWYEIGSDQGLMLEKSFEILDLFKEKENFNQITDPNAKKYIEYLFVFSRALIEDRISEKSDALLTSMASIFEQEKHKTFNDIPPAILGNLKKIINAPIMNVWDEVYYPNKNHEERKKMGIEGLMLDFIGYPAKNGGWAKFVWIAIPPLLNPVLTALNNTVKLIEYGLKGTSEFFNNQRFEALQKIPTSLFDDARYVFWGVGWMITYFPYLLLRTVTSPVASYHASDNITSKWARICCKSLSVVCSIVGIGALCYFAAPAIVASVPLLAAIAPLLSYPAALVLGKVGLTVSSGLALMLTALPFIVFNEARNFMTEHLIRRKELSEQKNNPKKENDSNEEARLLSKQNKTASTTSLSKKLNLSSEEKIEISLTHSSMPELVVLSDSVASQQKSVGKPEPVTKSESVTKEESHPARSSRPRSIP